MRRGCEQQLFACTYLGLGVSVTGDSINEQLRCYLQLQAAKKAAGVLSQLPFIQLLSTSVLSLPSEAYFLSTKKILVFCCI